MDDRNHYRTLSWMELIERAKRDPSAELAVVLGEDLLKILIALEDADIDANELLHRN